MVNCLHCVVLLMIALTTVAALERPSDEQLSQVPDLTNPANAKELKCNSCRALAREVFEVLTPLIRLRHGHPKHYELVDAVDNLCASIGKNYGLLLKNNKPTTEFSKNAAITRYTGSWINTYLERRCGELMEHYDEDLLREVLRTERLEHYRDVVCSKWEKSCTSTESVREDL